MTKIGLFFGTQTGNTETIAETIQEVFGGDSVVTLHNVVDTGAADLEGYEYLIIGCPTWNVGELQADWEGLYELTDERINTWVTQLKRFGV